MSAATLEAVAQAAALPFETETIDLGTPVHYADFGGDGEVMILVHGIASSHLNWTSIGPQLAEKFRVYAVDLPGYGFSPAPPEPAYVETSAKYLDRFVDKISGGKPVVLFGHSMGGLVSILQAGGHPEKVDRLILMAPAAPIPFRASVHPMALPFLLAMAMPERAADFLRERGKKLDAEIVVRRVMKQIIGPRSTIPEDIMVAHIELLTRQREEHDWNERTLVESAASLVRATRRRAYRELAAKVNAPTLLMHGTRDRLVRYQSGLWLHRRRPDWDFQPMEGLGHMLQMEDPEWVLWTVMDWLRRTPAARVAAG